MGATLLIREHPQNQQNKNNWEPTQFTVGHRGRRLGSRLQSVSTHKTNNKEKQWGASTICYRESQTHILFHSINQ